MMESELIDKKTISITENGQITIPLKFFEALDFGNEAECVLRNNAIIIRPIKQGSGGEFAEQILSDLIAQGYSGQELLTRFKQMQRKIRPAIEKVLAEADEAASGKSEFSTYNDIFGTGEE